MIILFGQSPGNVSGNLLIWVKSNSNVYEGNGSDNAEDGDEIQFWDKYIIMARMSLLN